MEDKLIFVGGIFPKEKLEELEQTLGFRDVPADTLQKSIIQGIESNTGKHLTIFNLYFIHAFFSKRICRMQPYTWAGALGGTNYNLPFLHFREYTLFSKSHVLRKYLGRWLKKNNPNGKTKVLVYSAYFPFLKGLAPLKRKYNLEICLIVPDLPIYMGLQAKKTLHNKVALSVSDTLFRKYLPVVDSFVFLTEQMGEVLNPSGKPHVVIEGIASDQYVYKELQPQQNPRIVLYSGGLQEKYGISVLLEATQMIQETDVEFRFYGSGDAVGLIQDYAKKDSRIRYLGTIAIQDLHDVQQISTVLVNPRQNNETFTKYSFPSKNLEYMLSGRPTVAYKLDGMPAEYEDYLWMPKDNSAAALAVCIRSVLQMPFSQQQKAGERARRFVLENKNCITQTKKILELLS